MIANLVYYDNNLYSFPAIPAKVFLNLFEDKVKFSPIHDFL